MPPRIFISYRRADSKHITSRIRERLTDAFGKDTVFHDVEKIPPGSDFRGVLREATTTCRVMLVVIGKGWVNATDASSNRRLDNPADFVRIEVETGLQRDGVTVIPLLVDGADMPAESQLPDSLKLLAYKNAFIIHDDPIFAHDMETLTRYLRSLIGRNGGVMRYVAAALALIVLIGALALIVPPLLNRESPTLTPTTQAALAPTPTFLTRAPFLEPTPTDAPTNEPSPTLTPSPEPSNTFAPTLAPTLTELEAALDLARSFAGTQNTDWQPFVYTFPDDPAAAPMVLIPVGSFQMGSPDGVGEDDEHPMHRQTFSEPFWIDQTEVTRAQYRLCVSAGACSETPASDYSTRDTQPINRVTWFQARDYCAWRADVTGEAYRLPQEREWEYAARGVESWIYPWGNNDPTADLAVYGSTSTSADVGSKSPAGDSWVGAQDLSGNVWEWVNTIYGVDLNGNYIFGDTGERLYSYPYIADDGRETDSENSTDVRILRGGSFISSSVGVRGANRDRDFPSIDYFIVGFRCARS